MSGGSPDVTYDYDNDQIINSVLNAIGINNIDNNSNDNDRDDAKINLLYNNERMLYSTFISCSEYPIVSVRFATGFGTNFNIAVIFEFNTNTNTNKLQHDAIADVSWISDKQNEKEYLIAIVHLLQLDINILILF